MSLDPAHPTPPYRPVPLPPHLVDAAAEADRELLRIAGRGEGRYALYALLRQGAARAARCDSFYVGFCGEGRTVVFPYNYDGAEFDDPNVNPWRPGGLTEWIVTHRRPYWAALDGGALLHRGRPFGDAARRSKDAVAVPLLSPAGAQVPRRKRRVVGIVSLLSYEPDVYDTGTVRLLECLAESLMVALERDDEDRARRRRFSQAAGPPSPAAVAPGPDSSAAAAALAHLNARLRDIRRRAADASALAGASDPAVLRAALDALCRECEQAQTEAIEHLLPASAAPLNTQDSTLPPLTPREAEVAALMAAGLTNRQIGERLFVSELTAKTHCQSVLRKLGVRGRAAVALVLGSGGSTPTE